MLQVDPLFVLLTVQSLLVFAGLTFFLIIKYRKLSKKEMTAQRQLLGLKDEAAKQAQIKHDLRAWKLKFNDLKEKFEGIRTANQKLKSSLASLIPEAERSKEYEQLIADIEQNNQTLDNCVGSLQKENENLEHTVASLEREAEGLADLLQQTVRKEELDRALEQKQSLQLKYEKIVKEHEKLSTEHENLQKSNEALQKEYQALYDNIEAEKQGA